MLIRRIAASLLSGVLAFVGIASYSAYAKDPELYFYPAKKWQVSKISAAAPGKLPTCAITSTFNNGFSLQFAGTADGFANLNIDFKQPTFEKGRKYDVTYSIPGTSESILSTSAFEKNLLVADMRGQTEFSQSLRSASVFDIKIKGNEFRFYLTGFEAAMKDFNNCVEVAKPALAQVSPASPSQEEGSVLPVPDESVSASAADAPQPASMPDEPAQVDALKEIYAPASATAAASVATPAPTASAKPVAAESLDIASGKSASPEKQQDVLKEEAQTSATSDQAELDLYKRPRYTDLLAKQMKEENKKYAPVDTAVKQDAAPSDAPSPAASNTESEGEKNAAHAPMKMTAAETSPQGSEPPKPKTISTKIPAVIIKKAEPIKATADFTKLGIEQEMESIEPAAEADPSPSQAQDAVPLKEVDAPQAIEPLAEELANISPASGHSVDDFTDMRAKITEMEEQIAKLSHENASLDGELKATLKASEEERLSVSSDNWNLERATMRFNEAERQISRLGRQLQSAKAQCDAEKSDLEGMLFDPKLTDQQQLAKLSSLEEKLDETKSELQTQRRTYEERIRLLEAQLEKAP